MGELYNHSQKIIHKKPMIPIIKNALCHPQYTAIHGTVSGASIAPTLEPELKIPVANERSFFGKYSAVAFMAAGKFPDSPIAKTALDAIKPNTETGTAANPIQPTTCETAVPTGIE